MSGAAGRVLEWFRSRHRDVPGRNESDPYRVWVAEVMAQQTRISTVIPYYESFLERFPDLETLAASSLDDVLKAWEGLGYYGRARNLHRAAREVRARYGGLLPEDPDALRALPGIGAYTAGAIASIAFGKAEPAVDGNVRRVLCRLYDIEKPTAGRLDALCRDLIVEAGGAAGILNQALMDLGSSICTPRNPACGACPLAGRCLAFDRGTVALRPSRPKRAPIPSREVAAALVWRGPRLLIARRPEDGLLGGLWEFPGGRVESGETPAEAARREVREELGIEVEIHEKVEEIRHAYSHFRITLHLFHARWVEGDLSTGEPPARAPRWVLPGDLVNYAFPAANQGVIRRFARGEEQTPEFPGPA